MTRQTGLILTIVSALLCGCPGLLSCFFGLIFSAAGVIPDANIDVFGSSDPMAALAMGLGTICSGIIFVAIPVALWFFTVRGKSD